MIDVGGPSLFWVVLSLDGSRLSFGPQTSSQIMKWRLTISYEYLALFYACPLALITYINLFLFIFMLPQGVLPFFLSVSPTLCVCVCVSGWWLPGCPKASPFLLPHSPLPSPLSLLTYSLCPPARSIPLLPSYWPFNFILDQ